MSASVTVAAQAVGNALYGLQRQGDNAAMHSVLRALAPTCCVSPAATGAQEQGAALYGLQRQNASATTQAVLEVRAAKIVTADLGRMRRSSEMYCTVYNRRATARSRTPCCMPVHRRAARRGRCWEHKLVARRCTGCVGRVTGHVQTGMLQAHAVIASSPCALDAQARGKALYGLQLRVDDVGCQALRQTIAVKTIESQTGLGVRGTSNVLYGLQRRTLAARRRTSQSACDAQDSDDATFRLQGQASNTAVTAGRLRNEMPQRPERASRARGALRCAPAAITAAARALFQQG